MADDIKKWDEFKWESIFREEDLCINAYMHELPRYIDLPEEEEILFDRVRRLQKSLPEANRLYDKLYDNQFNFSEEESILPNGWRNLNGSDIYRKLLEYSSSWIRTCVSSFGPGTFNLGIRGACLYSILISRNIGIMEMPSDMPHLVIASCKRMNATINDIIGLANEISRIQPDLVPKMNEHSCRLLLVREKILKLMEENRKKTGQ